MRNILLGALIGAALVVLILVWFAPAPIVSEPEQVWRRP